MNTRSKSSLFLIELVIVILVFSLSAAVCLRMFFQSRQISSRSRNISQASLAVQSVADCYRSMKGDYEKTADFLDGTTLHSTICFYYNSVWESVGSKEEASFIIEIEKINDLHKESSVTAYSLDGAAIFSVTVRGELNLG